MLHSWTSVPCLLIPHTSYTDSDDTENPIKLKKTVKKLRSSNKKLKKSVKKMKKKIKAKDKTIQDLQGRRSYT